MFSELAAPLYEEDEQDFLSEDREPDNPSEEDEMGDDDPGDAIYETSSGEDNKPNFASSRFEKSVTENVNSARTAEEETYFGSDVDQGKGEDLPFPNASWEGNVSASLPFSSTLDSANAENKKPELPDVHTGEPDVEIDSKLEKGSIDLEKVQAEKDSAVNLKYESSVKQADDKEIDNQQEKEQSNSKKMQFEQDLTVNSVNAEDSKTEHSVKEEPAEKEAEIDSVVVNRANQDPKQEEPRSTDSSGGMPFEDGAKELSDEDLEHLRVNSKPSQVQVPSDALEEEEQDRRKNKKEEAEEQEANKRMEEQARKIRLEKAKRDAEEKKKVLEEQSRIVRLEKEKRDAEEKKKAVEEQTRKLMLEKEKRIAEEKKKAIAAQARKVRLEKEKRAAEEEKLRKQEEERLLRLESLKKQQEQIEETEKMEMERLRREEEEEKEISLEQLSGAERTEEVIDKVPGDEGIDQEKENLVQEEGKTSKDGEDEEHMKIKGAFDRKMAEEEAELRRKLEMLNEERRNFEKMAEEYRVSKKERQQKEQENKMSTKNSAESELSKAATAVSPSSKQVKTSHDQGWYM